ncbi:MAG: GNAT family N-acetyltransferase [Candidatus Omnitrophota bacterium]
MDIRKFDKNDINELKILIDSTIDDCYQDKYCPQAIAYFKQFHSIENILKDAAAGDTFVLRNDSEIIGTGTLLGTEIRRVFVLKEFQGQGLGKQIMLKLEEAALGEGLKKVTLCSSLVAKRVYDKLGYVTVKKGFIDLGSGKRLDYYDMEKCLEVMQEE